MPMPSPLGAACAGCRGRWTRSTTSPFSPAPGTGMRRCRRRALPATVVAAGRVANRRWAFADAARLYQRAELLGENAGRSPGSVWMGRGRRRLAGDLEAAIGTLGRAPEEREQPARARSDHPRRCSTSSRGGRTGRSRSGGGVRWSSRATTPWSRRSMRGRCGRGGVVADRRRAEIRDARPGCRGVSGRRRFAGIAHNALGVATALSGDLPQALDHLRAALAAAREAGGADDLVAAYVNLGNILGLSGRRRGAVGVCRTGSTISAAGACCDTAEASGWRTPSRRCCVSDGPARPWTWAGAVSRWPSGEPHSGADHHARPRGRGADVTREQAPPRGSPRPRPRRRSPTPHPRGAWQSPRLPRRSLCGRPATGRLVACAAKDSRGPRRRICGVRTPCSRSWRAVADLGDDPATSARRVATGCWWR